MEKATRRDADDIFMGTFERLECLGKEREAQGRHCWETALVRDETLQKRRYSIKRTNGVDVLGYPGGVVD